MRNFVHVLLLLCSLGSQVCAQPIFEATLRDKENKAPIPYAHIFSPEQDAHALTDEQGAFRLRLLKEADSITLIISALGVKDSMRVVMGRKQPREIFISQPATRLEEVELKGLSARQIVRRAVKEIPNLYASTAFGAYGFYRQYQQVNRQYQNLIEAQLMVRFAPRKTKKGLAADEAFSIPFIRRSKYREVTGDGVYGDEICDLMLQNPIYHLYTSSFNPGRMAQYSFRFDTITDDFYTISYDSKVWTSDPHGIDNYNDLTFTGEAVESGTVKIQKETFAIMKVIRKVKRNPTYDYPRRNNFVLPSRRHRLELVSGLFVAEYEPVGDTWYPKRLLHSFTNDYREARMSTLLYTVEENFEWHAQSITRKLSPDWRTPFYQTPYLSTLPYTYEPQNWAGDLPNFFFGIEELVHQDIRAQSNNDLIFLPEGKETDTQR